MKKNFTLKHQFVTAIPERVKDRTLYVSLEYATAVHKCACGCGSEIVTPISPTDWKMIFDGEAVSLHPSIGNWGLPCRSHYWIKGDRVNWAGDMPRTEITNIRADDRQLKDRSMRPTGCNAINVVGIAGSIFDQTIVKFIRTMIGR